jgi:hypothetical protein
MIEHPRDDRCAQPNPEPDEGKLAHACRCIKLPQHRQPHYCGSCGAQWWGKPDTPAPTVRQAAPRLGASAGPAALTTRNRLEQQP